MVGKEYWNQYEGAKIYASLMPHIDYYVELQDRVLELIGDDETVGDFACGPGLFSKRCLEHGKRVFSLDGCQAMLDFFRDIISDKDGNLPGNLNIVQGDINRIDSPNDSFDSVVCMNAVYNNENPNGIISELVRIAKKRIIITGPKPNYDHDLLLTKAKDNFSKHALDVTSHKQVKKFIEGNEQLKNSHMPSPLLAQEVSSMLLDHGCSSIYSEEDIYHGQGFLVVGIK